MFPGSYFTCFYFPCDYFAGTTVAPPAARGTVAYFPGGYFTCFYFPCTYFPGSDVRPITFREALQTGLQDATALTAVVGSRISPMAVSQLSKGVALTWQVVSQNRSRCLDRPTGVVAARVRFHARGKRLLECEQAMEGLRQTLDHFRGTFGGLTVLEALMQDVRDESLDPQDATGMHIYSIFADVLMRYRESIPTRFN